MLNDECTSDDGDEQVSSCYHNVEYCETFDHDHAVNSVSCRASGREPPLPLRMSWNMPYLVPPPPEVVVTGGQLAARPDHGVSAGPHWLEVCLTCEAVKSATPNLPLKHHWASFQCWSLVERLLAMG